MATLREMHPLRLRKIWKKSFTRMVSMAALAAVLSAVGYFILRALVNKDPFAGEMVASPALYQVLGGWVLLMAILVFYAPFYEYLYFIYYFYDMDERNVIIRKGIFTKREVTLPFKKITDVYMDQDVPDFILGLYDVHISTPTVESGLFAHIDGVDKKGAVAIRKLILDAIQKSES